MALLGDLLLGLLGEASLCGPSAQFLKLSQWDEDFLCAFGPLFSFVALFGFLYKMCPRVA